MSTNVTINGTTYAFPTTGDENWGTIVSQWAQAVSQHLLQKSGGNFTLTSEVNFGATYGLKSAYIKSQASNPSSSGVFRLGNDESISWRNQANNADIAFKVNSSNKLLFNTDELVSLIATQTLTNKTINADDNTITNLEVDNLKSGVLDTDLSSVSGSDDTIPSAKAVKAYVDGLIASQNEADEISFDNTSSGLIATYVQGAIDEVDSSLDKINTLSGVAKDSVHLGTFTGGTIADNQTIKQGLQSLETSLEEIDSNVNDLISLTGIAENTAHLGSFTGSIIPDDQNIKQALQAVETEVETKASSSSLSSHTSASSGVHGLTGSVVGTSDTQTLTNKTLTSPIVNSGSINEVDINLGTASNSKKLVISKDTYANLNSLTREEASVYFGTDAKKLYVDDGSSLIEVGSGSSGGINYISNTDLEVNSDGFSIYADAAQSTPENGTGGSATSTISRSASSPLRGDYSLIFSKPASNEQGEGFSYDFTIDSADKNNILEVSFDYDASNANYADDYMSIFIYDVTNSQLIRFNGEELKGKTNGKFLAFFQASTSTSYRLIAHVVTTTTTAWDVKFDNFNVSPNKDVTVANLSNSIVRLDTANGYGSTNTKIRRYTNTRLNLGSDITYADSATLGASFTINTTGVYSISLSESQSSNSSAAGISLNASGTTNVTSLSSELVLALSQLGDGSIENRISCSWTGNLTKGDVIRAHTNGSIAQNNADCKFTIVRVNSVDTTNAEYSGRFQTCTLTLGSNQSTGTSNSTVNLNTVVKDTAGMADTTNFRIYARESGFYNALGKITFATLTGNELCRANIKKNGTTVIAASANDASGSSSSGNVYLMAPAIELVKGDYLEIIVSSATDGSSTVIAGFEESSFTVTKIANPVDVVKSNEDVRAEYYGNGGTGITADFTDITFNTKTYDTHSAWDGDQFTVPITGSYTLTGMVRFSTAISASALVLYVGGTASKVITYREQTCQIYEFSTTQYFTKGQVVSLRLNRSVTLSNGTIDHWIMIKKLN